MDKDTALRINAAACRLYLMREGLLAGSPVESVAIIRSVSEAQIATAIEVVEAINAESMRGPAPHVIRCMLADTAIGSVKRYADALRL